MLAYVPKCHPKGPQSESRPPAGRPQSLLKLGWKVTPEWPIINTTADGAVVITKAFSDAFRVSSKMLVVGKTFNPDLGHCKGKLI